MMNSDSDIESEIRSDIDNLITKIGDMEIKDNFVNLKPEMKPDNIKPEIKQENWIPSVNDIPTTSRQIPIRREFSKPTQGYAAMMTTIRKEENYKPYESMKNEPINPFGIYLDLDCISNTEEAIDKWETAFRIAVSVNKMDIETVVSFLERTLLNSSLRYWQNLNPDIKKVIFETDNILANIITRAVEAFRIEFCGEGNILKDPATVKKYSTALLRLQLCDICEIDRYICVFQDYYYHIYNQVLDTSSYLPLFFAKIPDPWGQKLINTYDPGFNDTLGKRISHVRDKLSEWCGDAILAKRTKGLKKRISLCCDKPKMPLMIGCDSSYYYGKIKRKYKRKSQNKKRYFKKRKTNYYKKKGYSRTSKPTFKRKPKPKECRCYYCKEVGHYANKCPKKFGKNIKKFEIDEDIEKMINDGDFIQINDFREVDSDESIFILTDTEYTSSENE